MNYYFYDRCLKGYLPRGLAMAKYIIPVVCSIPILFLLATYAGADIPEPEFVKEHSQLFTWFLGAALLMNGFFLVRSYLSLERLWKEQTKQGKLLSALMGAHNAHHSDNIKED